MPPDRSVSPPGGETIEAMARFLWSKYAPDPDDIGPLPFEVNPDDWRRDARALVSIAADIDYRAEVLAEVVEMLRTDDTSSSHYAADLIERWEAKR